MRGQLSKDWRGRTEEEEEGEAREETDLVRASHFASGMTCSCLPPICWKTSAPRPFSSGLPSVQATAVEVGDTMRSPSVTADDRTRSMVIGDGQLPNGACVLAMVAECGA